MRTKHRIKHRTVALGLSIRILVISFVVVVFLGGQVERILCPDDINLIPIMIIIIIAIASLMLFLIIIGLLTLPGGV